MTVKNKYANRSKISEAKFRELIRLCPQSGCHPDRCSDRVEPQHGEPVLKGPSGADCPVLRRTISPVRRDRSRRVLLGPRRVKGKQGRGAFGKTIVFGLFKRNGKVYTEIVPNCSKNTLQAIIRGKVGLESVIYSNGWRGYNGLVDVGYGKHLRVDHGKDQFVSGPAHINGIEGFWGFAKS